MSFLIKTHDIHPGFCLYRPSADNSANLAFVGGTFQALSGAGTNTLTFEGGYRYYVEHDLAHSTTVDVSAFPQLRVSRLYGAGAFTANEYTRFSASGTQKWNTCIVMDAISDLTVGMTFSNRSRSDTISIWRVPL
jgi:hypothetical protein